MQAKPPTSKPLRKTSLARPSSVSPPVVSPWSTPVLLPIYGGGSKSMISSIEPQLDRVLLYASPDHGAFFAASYIIGGFLLIGGYSYAQMFLKDAPDRPIHWVFKSLGAISTVAVVGFGTTFLMAPMKLIRSVAIVTQTTGATPFASSRILRVEVKRNLPFLKPDVLETTPSKMVLDRNVPGSVQEIRFQNVPLSQTRSFTEDYFTKHREPHRGGAMASVLAANRSMLSLWPSISREIRRMFLRDQMAYVRIEGNGSFKLDLQDCQLLDSGKPLHRVTIASNEARPSLLGTIAFWK
ncbi:hypothetical protein DOTSEDRAFT_67874 [Dothistroma septosporum NZE10]|uniref:Uncharacterized protein n=1 Tax=Dothistroma septosporum (strain NZE10 / CBS 128990) TaxID=675120 RepID=N1PZM0_DOTSN|nr:hypothetical protein DOTSEDRAFT_67874 [Dothistroma septosporum NZE10]